ncbi:MAG: glycosyltransferase [Calditrichaeota bacterium]|nr:MAG: glycosyltransferase [Calditrichota bacterium]
MKSLKVLVLADAKSFHTERFVGELSKQGCEVKLVSLEQGEIEHHLLERKGSIRQLHYYRSIKEIVSVVNQHQPDIISAHFASGYGHLAAKVSQKTDVPYTVHLWGSDILIVPDKSFLHKMKTVKALKHASYIFGDSDYLLNEARKLFPFTHSKMIVWGVEERYLSMHKSSYKLIEPLRVIVPRAHEDVYNNLFIVSALQDLIRENRISITFPSFGSKYESFKQESEKIVGDNIQFYDKKLRADYLQFASTFDIYLSASRSDSSPVSLIEALALGLIPVAADIVGVQEWLSANNGFLFTQDDKNSLRGIFEKILNTTDDMAEIRKGNLSKVKSSAIFEQNIRQQIDIFNQVVRGEIG